MSNTGQAWVTLATNDSYALGALVLAQSLKRNNTIHQLAILITPGVSSAMREVLSSTFDLIKEVDVLDSRDAANLALLARPDLGITFTKLHCWNLTQYTKCVFLDADTLVIKNCDELFERDELSAAPDAGWPDCFNSGVFVFTPSEATFKSLLEFALTNGSFDGGDQGLLNTYFGDWATKDITKHLPFVYNMVASATYSYLPAFKAYGGNVKIAHFIGGTKPWLQTLPGGSTLSSFLDLWWDIFLKDVSKKLNTNMGGLAGALAGGQKDIIEDQWRKQSWEQGNIDYMGKDAFENIWKKIAETVGEDIKPLEAPVPVVPLEAPVPVVPLGAPVPVVPSAQEESALAPATEAPKTEDKTDSPNVDIEKASEQPVEKPQTKVEEGRVDQPQPEGVKPETTPEISPAVEPATLPKPDTPPEVPSADTKKEETPKAEPLVPTAEEAQVPAVKPEDTPKQSTDAPLVAQTAPPLQPDPIEPAVTKSEPVQPAEVVPATEQPSAPIQPVVPAPSTDELVPQAPTETVPKDQSPPTVAPQRTSPPKTAIEVPPSPEIPEPAKDPKTPTTLPADKKGPSPPKDDPKPPEPPKDDSKPPEPTKDDAKPPEPPKDDAKPPEPPKDGGAEKVATPVQEPIAPTSPTLPGPASPSAPEGTKVDSVQPPISPEPQAPSGTETSTPPQTPTGDAPVPPKRSSKKGKAKK